MRSGNGSPGQLDAVHGDITTLPADAIVNAANTRMRGGGGVDGAIHARGGPTILAECIELFPHGLPVGEAGATTAGALPARWVIHVVGPNYRAGQRDPFLLTSAYRRAMQVADGLGARSITLPAVSAGIFGWPLTDAARIAVSTVREELTGASCVLSARFVLFDEDTLAVFRAVIEG